MAMGMHFQSGQHQRECMIELEKAHNETRPDCGYAQSWVSFTPKESMSMGLPRILLQIFSRTGDRPAWIWRDPSTLYWNVAWLIINVYSGSCCSPTCVAHDKISCHCWKHSVCGNWNANRSVTPDKGAGSGMRSVTGIEKLENFATELVSLQLRLAELNSTSTWIWFAFKYPRNK